MPIKFMGSFELRLTSIVGSLAAVRTPCSSNPGCGWGFFVAIGRIQAYVMRYTTECLGLCNCFENLHSKNPLKTYV
ncbi:MAG: hypothetical protein KME15_10265 [Drouetiella hepatica Uher 2000/2452]|uniref:Uncharacterized protein n=1 Tax=Drouetiella hepatica Uher 2000/2452 TaxID=904376 RepID=A0A951QBW5_9CYAN|nr:hypothetical protein [Drouetiella hepatica Uher 2000/2452]